MRPSDLHMSSGAYVLHALPEEERRAFEDHLATCESCRMEVAEFRATAARLGSSLTAQVSPGVREEVLRQVAQTPQDSRLRTVGASRRWVRRLPRLVPAACLAVAAALGGVAGCQHQEAEDARAATRHVQQEQASVADVLTAPDARLTSKELAGGVATVAFSRSQDGAALSVSGLTQLPRGRVYEAWFINNSVPVPAGLLSRGSGQQLTPLRGSVDQATAVAISVEPSGGSPRPTTVPLGAISLAG